MGNQLSASVPQQIYPLDYYLNDLNYLGEFSLISRSISNLYINFL